MISKKHRKLQKRIAKDQFDFNDFIAQIQQIKKMGNVKDLMAMIPGVGKAIKDLDIDDNAFKGIEAIIRSMTPEERIKSCCSEWQQAQKNCNRKRNKCSGG